MQKRENLSNIHRIVVSGWFGLGRERWREAVILHQNMPMEEILDLE